VLTPQERTALLHELDAMHARGTLPPHLAQLRNEIAAVEAATPAAAGTKAGAA
jgi:pyruvate/2-oxoacid:ferredoxin oxidoreductase alpha subunit